MWPVVGTGIENRSASSQLDCLGCLATGVICEAVFMSSGYFCGFSNSFFSQDGERAGSYHYQQCNGISKMCVATIYGTCFPWPVLVALKAAITSALLRYPFFCMRF